MMTFEMLLIGAIAAATGLMLFGVVLYGDYQDHHPHSAHK